MTTTMGFELPRARRAVVAFLASIALVSAGTPVVQALGKMVSVVVMARDAGQAAVLVQEQHGEVDTILPIIDGVAAHVPEGAIAGLSRYAFVARDYPLRVQSASFGDSLESAYPKEVRAPEVWQRGLTGKGVTVALIDTGVSDVPDLKKRVVAEANFTLEKTFTDSYGHGTFQAGLIAGDGTASGGKYVGIAPEASLMSIKVADKNGTTSLVQVLAGAQLLDWSAKRFNVRVALLALSSGSPFPPYLDPLSFALRQLWAHGVTVVVPAGNEGASETGKNDKKNPNAPGTVTAPGEDPVLLTAGSVDDRGTPAVADDAVSDFTGRGPTRWGDDKPDIAAPGEHLVSLRAPGSTVDKKNQSARVGKDYFKGSGTSMSAAVTAGTAALAAQAHPGATPDAIKALLVSTAVQPDSGSKTTTGDGVVDIDAASAKSLDDLGELPPVPDVADASAPFEVKAFGFKWVGRGPARWLPKTLARTWNGRTWNARSWNARTWNARSWNARSWNARTWAARTWNSRTWNARTWAARTWAGRTWAGRTWTSRTWSARTWTSAQWEARTWSARTWSARTWSARSWSAEGWG